MRDPRHPITAAYDRYLAGRHFGSLDGLRFLCITAVIWHHAPVWPPLRDSVSVLFARGHTGVDFFFVLSGFLITTLLLREEAARGRFSLRAFYWRRALRIIPIYFLVVSIAGFYAIVLKGQTAQLAILPYYYLFLSNFLTVPDIGFLAPTWSLAVEEQYYLIWPALLLFVPRRWIVPLLVGLIVLNVLGAMGAFAGMPRFEGVYLRFKLSGATYAPILMGSLVAVFLNRPAGFAAFWHLAGFRMAPWLWFMALLVVLAIPGPLKGLPNLAVHSLMCLVLASLVLREDNAMAPLLRLAPVARIGQISYGIYLYHLFALAIVDKGFEVLGIASAWGVLVLYYGVAILISEISFRTYEAWFLAFRQKGPGRITTKLSYAPETRQ
jgi:peptidoglycan/LPS O-acetylase OafA/YrhL